MANADPYGAECPFCATPVPAAARICTGCHAHKGVRADAKQSPIVRMFAWCSSLGFLVVVYVMVIYALWTTARSDGPLQFQAYAWATLAAWIVGGAFVIKLADMIWVWIFGRLSDPLWVRKN